MIFDLFVSFLLSAYFLLPLSLVLSSLKTEKLFVLVASAVVDVGF